MENDITNQQELLAKNLAYYRKASGLTQLELADKFNYSDKSVSKWERGEGFPDIFVLKSLADFYGITVDDFYQSEHKAVKVSQNKKRKQTYLKLLSIGINWLVTVLTFFLLNTLLSRFAPDAPFEPWLTFIYGTLTTGIILLVWEFIYHNRFLRMIATSIIIWTAALSLFLTFFVVMNLPLPLLFVVAIPLEVLEIIWYLFRRNRKR
ncbi:MAG: helix-turn-helix transcriptional regulator [Bacilli bacterium]|nr:helix-turn-helix transcriptional regulator [Bacilli bacterium]